MIIRKLKKLNIKNATIQVLLQSRGELFFALGLGNGSVTLTTEAIKENIDKFEH